MWKLFGGRKGLKQLKTGRSTGRFFGCTLGRSVFSLLLAAVLVLSDALPIPGGLPGQVEAYDRYPSKGTITFYRYTPITSFDQLNPGDEGWRDTFMMYEIGGVWYAPNSKILGTDNWPVGKAAQMLPHFNSEGGFYSRVKSYVSRWCSGDWWVCKKPLFFTTKSPNGESARIQGSWEGNKIYPAPDTSLSPFEVSNSRQQSGFYECAFRFIYTVDGERTWGFYLMGDSSKIYGSGGEGRYFRMYQVNSFTYTCINSNYTIGENQVYVADRDLFLREGVKLTIPEGSVLCVKNGPFYVNGEIECYGTILVEDGGIIMPYESTDAGSRIVMKEGGAMIIRSGGRVYAGCPKGSLWTQGDNGWLDMYAGSSIINFGLLVAGKCNFTYGQATIENHKGARMYLGYSVSNEGEHNFMSTRWPGGGAGTGTAGTLVQNPSESSFGLVKTNGTVHYGKGNNITVVKTWDGASTSFANKDGSGGQSIKMYSYDKNGKCTVNSDYKP